MSLWQQKITEIAHLVWSLSISALRILVTDPLFCPRLPANAGGAACAWPNRTEDLTAAVMSLLMGRKVVKVQHNKKLASRAAADVGAGGNGTSRAWLNLTFVDGHAESVFVKLPAGTFSERLFLTAFRVYHNELDFYRGLADQPSHAALPRRLFARVHYARMWSTRFVLVLEDLGKTGATFPPLLGEHPKEQAEGVIRAYAQLHSAAWNAPPKGVWTDEWSAGLTSPPGIATEATRPRFLRLIGEETLKKVKSKFVMPADIEKLYQRFVLNEKAVRKFWSTKPLTMVHGDSHLGNCFFRADGTAGFYDMQCVAAEHGMRDIAYHLCSGYARLEEHEQEFVQLYCDTLNPLIQRNGHAPLTFDSAWFMYRLHIVWALAAFVISAGASNLMDERVARPVLDRIFKAARRLDSAGALEEVLAGRQA